MKTEWRMRTPLPPRQAARRIVTMTDHRVPFTQIDQDREYVEAVTTIGPVTIVDRMEVGPLEVSGGNIRGQITKTGPVLGGTLSFAAVSAGEGSVVGWKQDLTLLPCPMLDPVLTVIMRLGYRLAFAVLLR